MLISVVDHRFEPGYTMHAYFISFVAVLYLSIKWAVCGSSYCLLQRLDNCSCAPPGSEGCIPSELWYHQWRRLVALCHRSNKYQWYRQYKRYSNLRKVFGLHGFCGYWLVRIPLTSLTTPVTPTDRPKSVYNPCVIKDFGGVFCVVILLFRFSVRCMGFCHRTESDICLFLLTLSII